MVFLKILPTEIIPEEVEKSVHENRGAFSQPRPILPLCTLSSLWWWEQPQQSVREAIPNFLPHICALPPPVEGTWPSPAQRQARSSVSSMPPGGHPAQRVSSTTPGTGLRAHLTGAGEVGGPAQTLL